MQQLYKQLMQGETLSTVDESTGRETLFRRPPTRLQIRAAQALKAQAEVIEGLERALKTREYHNIQEIDGEEITRI